MTIAFLSDLHLPYHGDAVQYKVLRWALTQAAEADLLVVAGDFTAAGDREAIDAFAREMEKCPVPAVILCGNAEYRSTAENAQAALRLQSPVCTTLGSRTVLSLCDGDARIPGEVYDALESADEHTVVVRHHPFTSLREPHRSRMNEWRQAHPEIPLFTAHTHRFRQTDAHTWELPAADPDKNIGTEAAVLFYDTETKEVRQQFYRTPVPADFADWLGLSCRDPKIDLPYAIRNKIRYVELRADAVKRERTSLLPLLEQWRRSGGKMLSLHAPEVYPDPQKNGAWAEFASFAADTKADRITLHVPQTSVASVKADPVLLSRMADFVGSALRDLPDSLVIGVENMHMTAKDTPDDNRRFGYIPGECRLWRDALAKATGKICGLHLDVGHARNNRPYSEKYCLGAWYAEIGREIVGYHLHQIRRDGNVWENHTPIDGWFGPLISYAGFLDAWSCGQLAKAPLFLEIRTPRGYEITVESILRRT